MTDADTSTKRLPYAQLLPLGVMLLALVPIVSIHALQLWSRAHYQFFPAVVFACVLLVVSRWPKAGWQCRSQRRAFMARCFYAIGMATFVVATAKISPLLAWGSVLLFMAGLLIHGRLPLWGPWLLLLLLFRLPFGWDDQLILWLQQVTTGISSMVLDALSIEHNVLGNEIQLPHQTLIIAETCSGVVSLMTLVATCVVFSVWLRRSFLHGLLLAASGFIWAGAMNIFRICTIVAASSWYDIDLLSDTPHAILGTVSFVLAVILILSTDRLLSFALAQIPDDPMAPWHEQTEGNPLVAAWNFVNHSGSIPDQESLPANDFAMADNGLGWRVFDWSLAVIAIGLAGAQFYAGIGPFHMASQIPDTITSMEKEFMPVQFGDWTLRDFEIQDRGTNSDFGEFSRIWTYTSGAHSMALSIDYPFQEWHELSACYRGDGWNIDASQISDNGVREILMTLPSSERAVLVFDLCEVDGSPFEVPAGEFLHPTWRRVLSGGSRWTMPTYVQIQAFVVATDGEISAELPGEARQAFEDFQGRIIQALQR